MDNTDRTRKTALYRNNHHSDDRSEQVENIWMFLVSPEII